MPIHNGNDTLFDERTFEEFFEDIMSNIDDFRPKYQGTNHYNFMKYIADHFFSEDESLENIKKTKMIADCYGLQLDDWGDELNVPRNGLPDDEYKFILIARFFARNSNGTQNELIDISASMLGCDPEDITLVRNRQYQPDGTIAGTPNTLTIKNVPYTKVTNDYFISNLPKELGIAANQGTVINLLGFLISTNIVINVPSWINYHEEIIVSIPKTVVINELISGTIKLNTGSYIKNEIKI